MGAGEIRAQPFAGLQLMRRDQGAAVAAAPAREPGEWAFSLVDGDAGATKFGDDLPLRQRQMLAAKLVDLGPQRFPVSYCVRRRALCRAPCGPACCRWRRS